MYAATVGDIKRRTRSLDSSSHKSLSLMYSLSLRSGDYPGAKSNPKPQSLNPTWRFMGLGNY